MVGKIFGEEQRTQGITSAHEQRYGTIASLSIHTIILMLFLSLSLVKRGSEVKTYFLEFAQIEERATSLPQPVQEMKQPKMIKAVRTIPREERPVQQETSPKEHESVIRDDTADMPDAVHVASSPEPIPQAVSHQGAEGPSGAISRRGVPGVIETEFGTTGAPAFLRKQIPVYPMMAKRLGKEGKVVLRLFIDAKGKLVNLEVVEPGGYGFTESAVEAVRMSSFSPAHVQGVNVASKALLTIRFVLKKS